MENLQGLMTLKLGIQELSTLKPGRKKAQEGPVARLGTGYRPSCCYVKLASHLISKREDLETIGLFGG